MRHQSLIIKFKMQDIKIKTGSSMNRHHTLNYILLGLSDKDPTINNLINNIMS